MRNSEKSIENSSWKKPMQCILFLSFFVFPHPPHTHAQFTNAFLTWFHTKILIDINTHFNTSNCVIIPNAYIGREPFAARYEAETSLCGTHCAAEPIVPKSSRQTRYLNNKSDHSRFVIVSNLSKLWAFQSGLHFCVNLRVVKRRQPTRRTSIVKINLKNVPPISEIWHC